jgi:hypothetical protein
LEAARTGGNSVVASRQTTDATGCSIALNIACGSSVGVAV